MGVGYSILKLVGKFELILASQAANPGHSMKRNSPVLAFLAQSANTFKHSRKTIQRRAFTAGVQFTNGVSSTWARYQGCLKKHPLRTKMITASIISFSSDVTCQAIESVASKGAGDGDFMKQYDIKRSMRLSAIGAFLLVPIMHNWYGLMGRVLPGRGNKVTIAKVILDQFVLSPPIVAMVLSANQILDGKAYNIPSKMKEVGLNILVRNWLVWGPVQVLNYKFVPVQFQVLFSNTVNYFWSIYVSSANNAPLRGHHTDTAAAAVSASAGQLMELQGSKP